MAKTMTKETKWQGWAVLGTLAVVVTKALVVLVSAPLFIGVWLLRFLKTIISTIIMWCVGKFAIFLLLGGVLSLISYIKESWMPDEKISWIIDGFIYHTWGEMSSVGYPAGSWGMFSYPKIEFTLIVLFALVTATVMTINPDKI